MAIPAAVPIAVGGIALAGSIIRNIQQAKEAQKQREFQERLSDTSYQRAVKDMRLAGINPMLAFQQGGASTPGGAQATVEDVAGPAVSSALQARRLSQEIRNMKAVEDRDRSSANTIRIQGFLAGEDINVRRDQREMLHSDIRFRDMSTAMVRLGMPEAMNRARVAESQFGRKGAFVQRMRELIFGSAGAFRPLHFNR